MSNHKYLKEQIKKIIRKNCNMIPGFDDMIADEIIAEITKSSIIKMPCTTVPWNQPQCANSLFCHADPEDCKCVGCTSQKCSQCLMWDQYSNG